MIQEQIKLNQLKKVLLNLTMFHSVTAKIQKLFWNMLEAKAGDTIAFIGSTGSGKSTLVNLIQPLYDATEGNRLRSRWH